MVLNLEDPVLSSQEVLEMELARLSLEQLAQLQARLGAGGIHHASSLLGPSTPSLAPPLGPSDANA